MNDLISIILPVYNVERYIKKCIESVINQSYTNFELLVVNDGTLDNSIEVVEEFNDVRIKIFHKENGGLSDARNFGLEKAKGDYVYFLDSDDWIESNLLEIAYNTIVLYNSKLVLFGYYLDTCDLSGILIDSKININETNVFVKNEKDIVFHSSTLNLLGYAWNKLYSRSFLRENNLIFDKGISLVEDVLFNSRVYEKADKIVLIEAPLYHYIVRPSTSLVRKFHENSFELILMKGKSLHSFLKSWNVNVSTVNKILSQNLNLGLRYSLNNLFAFKNDLKRSEKIAYIHMMLNNAETQKYIKYYEALSLNDKIYKRLVTSKAVLFLYLLCKIKK